MSPAQNYINQKIDIIDEMCSMGIDQLIVNSAQNYTAALEPLAAEILDIIKDNIRGEYIKMVRYAYNLFGNRSMYLKKKSKKSRANQAFFPGALIRIKFPKKQSRKVSVSVSFFTQVTFARRLFENKFKKTFSGLSIILPENTIIEAKDKHVQQIVIARILYNALYKKTRGGQVLIHPDCKRQPQDSSAVLCLRRYPHDYIRYSSRPSNCTFGIVLENWNRTYYNRNS